MTFSQTQTRTQARLLPLLALVLVACSAAAPDPVAQQALTQTARPRFPTVTPSPASSPTPPAGAAVAASPSASAAVEPSSPVASPSRVASVVAPASLTAQPSPQASAPSEIDALIAQMPKADKVGQLFVVGFPGADPAAALPMLRELRVGGFVLTTNVTTAASAKALSAALQRSAVANGLVPVLISANHEGGDVQPIRVGATLFGPQWELGQRQPLSAAVAAACMRGAVHGRELADMGIKMNLGPDLDVLDNPANTVIGQRAFSSRADVVAPLGVAYIEALQREGVLAVGKHFPGHGSSTEDSHQALPVVMHDRAELDRNELVPFVAAIQTNIAAIMVAHLSFPLIDPIPNQPSSLSPTFVTEILRKELGFEGLIVTDDIGQMKGVTTGRTQGDVAVEALMAGSDVLLTVGPLANEREMVQAVTAAIPTKISEERLDASVRRVLTAKAQVGLLEGKAASLSPSSTVCAATP